MLLRETDKTARWMFNAPWKSFYVNLLFEWLFCDILKAHPQSRCYSTLIGWCQRIHPIRVEQTAWLLHTKSRPRMLVASKAASLEKYLVVSTSILNGSSMHQPFIYLVFDLAIQFFGRKSAWRWGGRKWAFHPWLLLITFGKSQRKTRQIAQIRHWVAKVNEQPV